MNRNTDIEQLGQLKLEFLSSLDARISVLKTFWELLETTWSKDSCTYFLLHVRRLAGSASAFNLPLLVDITHPWLVYLRDADPAEPFPEDGKAYCRSNLDQLEQLNRYLAGMTEEERRDMAFKDLKALSEAANPLVYLVSGPSCCEEAAGLLRDARVNAKCLSDCMEFYIEFQKRRPDVAVIPFDMPQGSLLDFLATFRLVSQSGIPIITLLSPEQLEEHENALRGADIWGHFRTDIDASGLAGAVRQAARFREKPDQRILFVDDDEEIGSFFQTILRMGGFDTTRVKHLETYLQEREGLDPDLILIDLDHPEQGTEFLGEVKRAKESLQRIPILFLSSDPENDRRQFQDFGNAYAFVSKNVEPPDLLTAVTNRIQLSFQGRLKFKGRRNSMARV